MSDINIGKLSLEVTANIDQLKQGLDAAVPAVREAAAKIMQSFVHEMTGGKGIGSSPEDLAGKIIHPFLDALEKMGITGRQEAEVVNQAISTIGLSAEAAAQKTRILRDELAGARLQLGTDRATQSILSNAANAGSRLQLGVDRDQQRFTENALNAGARLQLSLQRQIEQERIAGEERVQKFLESTALAGARTQLNANRQVAAEKLAEEERVARFLESTALAGARTQLTVDRNTQAEQIRLQRQTADSRMSEEERVQRFLQKSAEDGARLQLAVDRNRIQQSQAQLNNLMRFGSELTGLGLRLSAAVTAPIVALAKESLEFAGNIQIASKSMERLLQSKNLADQIIAQIKQFSLTTPFEFKGTLEGYRKLLELGFAAKDTLKTLRILGDTTAAIGGDTGTLNRLILEFGKMRSEVAFTSQDLRILQRNAINAGEILAEGLGVSTDKMLKMIKARQISGVQAVEIILKGLAKQYEGEMQTRANTFQGLLQNVKEKILFALGDVGDALLPSAEAFLRWGFNAADNISRVAKRFQELPTWIQGSTVALLAGAAATGPALIIFGQLAESVFYTMKAFQLAGGAMKALGGAAPVAAGAIAVLAAAVTGFELTKFIQSVMDFVDLSKQARVESTHAAEAVHVHRTATEQFMNTLQQITSKPWSVIIEFKKKNEEFFKELVHDFVNHGPGIEGLIFPVAGNLRLAKEKMDMNSAALFEKQIIGNGAQANFNRVQNAVTNPFRVEVRNGKITNAFKTQEDDAARKMAALFQPDDEGDDDKAAKKAAQARAKAFSDAGLIDHILKIKELTGAIVELKKAGASGEQKSVFLETLLEELNAAYEMGVITEKQLGQKFRAALKAVGQDFNTFSDNSLKVGPLGDALIRMQEAIEGNEKHVAKLTEEQKKLDFPILKRDLADVTLAFMNSAYGVKEYADALDKLSQKYTTHGLAASRFTDLVRESLNIDVQKQNDPLKLLGVNSGVATIQEASKAIAKVREMAAAGHISQLDYLRALDNYYKLVIQNGGKLTLDQKLQMEQIERQINGVGRLKEMWRTFGGQVSTIFTDLGKEILDIFLPLHPAAKQVVDTLNGDVKSAFKNAFNDLVSKGYSDPVKAMNDIVASIKNAGSVADANKIAIRAFGQESGPMLARAIREGTLSIAEINKLIADNKDQVHDATAAIQEVSKWTELWRVAVRSLGRALIEDMAKALTHLLEGPLKKFGAWVFDMLKQLPILGTLLKKIAGDVADTAIKTFPTPTIPGADTSTGQVPGAPTGGGIPGVGGGVGSSAGSAVGGVMGAINMVSGVVSAVSSVIGNFQMAHMNTALGRIEESTRYLKIATTEGPDSISNKTKEIWQKLDFIGDRIGDMHNLMQVGVVANLENINNTLMGPIYQTLLAMVKAGGNAVSAAGTTVAQAAVSSAQAATDYVRNTSDFLNTSMAAPMQPVMVGGGVNIYIDGNQVSSAGMGSQELQSLQVIDKFARGLKNRGVGRGSRTNA